MLTKAERTPRHSREADPRPSFATELEATLVIPRRPESILTFKPVEPTAAQYVIKL
jgi:hypothetical protein